MRIHMCVDVRGIIRRLSASRAKMAPGITDGHGRPVTRLHAIELFMDELAKGHKVVPMGEPCEGFSYETGCPGHAAAVAEAP